MLLSLDYLIKKYNLKITGISHFGAHLGQEITSYKKNNLNNIHLFEPQKKIFEQLKSANENIDGLNFYNFGLGEANHKTILNLDTHESQSSSILTPKDHLKLHPQIKFEGTEEILIKRYDELDIKNVNFLNIDIQGYELKALSGSVKILQDIKYIYTEVNSVEVYAECVLIKDLDKFLIDYNFVRVKTKWFDNLAWGDAFYIKRDLISTKNYFISRFKNFIFKLYIMKYLEKYISKFYISINKFVYEKKQKIKKIIKN